MVVYNSPKEKPPSFVMQNGKPMDSRQNDGRGAEEDGILPPPPKNTPKLRKQNGM
jgi:hypothetical protein